MIKRFSLFIFIGLCICNSFAQNDSTFIRQGLLKGTATISPAFMLQHSVENIYVNGELEYFTEKNISIRGDAYWYLSEQQKPPMLNQNSFIAAGALYHIPKNDFDYFIGFQPAVSLVKPNNNDSLSDFNYSLKFCPTITFITGITYYVGDYFNFFLNLRFTKSRYFGYNNSVLNLDQLIISGGLGFNIQTKRH
jgi:hypothetical protein